MKIKLGIKLLSILSSMVLSLVVIAGCNDESAPGGGTAGPPPGAKKPGENIKPLPTTPTDKPADKPAEKKP